MIAEAQMTEETLRPYTVVDPDGHPFGHIHSVAYNDEANRVEIFGIAPNWHPQTVVLLPRKGCNVDSGTSRICVPDPLKTVRLLKHLEVIADVQGDAPEESLEMAIDRFLASMNTPAPLPQWTVDLMLRLGNAELTPDWLVDLVHASVGEAVERNKQSVSLAIPERFYDVSAQILDSHFRTNYCRGVILQEPVGNGLPVELLRKLPRVRAELTGLQPLTEEERQDFPVYVGSLGGHGA